MIKKFKMFLKVLKIVKLLENQKINQAYEDSEDIEMKYKEFYREFNSNNQEKYIEG